MIPAWKWGKAEKHEKLELTPEEEQLQEKIRTIWSAILSGQAIKEHTDFFKSGAGSMDVTRLLEEVREVTGVEMENDDVYMNSKFVDFVKQLVLTSRGGQISLPPPPSSTFRPSSKPTTLRFAAHVNVSSTTSSLMHQMVKPTRPSTQRMRVPSAS
jgi:acyl carrier protein